MTTLFNIIGEEGLRGNVQGLTNVNMLGGMVVCHKPTGTNWYLPRQRFIAAPDTMPGAASGDDRVM